MLLCIDAVHRKSDSVAAISSTWFDVYRSRKAAKQLVGTVEYFGAAAIRSRSESSRLAMKKTDTAQAKAAPLPIRVKEL
jgi:hypothetical protein